MFIMACLTVRAVGLLTEALSYEFSKTAERNRSTMRKQIREVLFEWLQV